LNEFSSASISAESGQGIKESCDYAWNHRACEGVKLKLIAIDLISNDMSINMVNFTFLNKGHLWVTGSGITTGFIA
jgi:hypothetical protein